MDEKKKLKEEHEEELRKVVKNPEPCSDEYIKQWKERVLSLSGNN